MEFGRQMKAYILILIFLFFPKVFADYKSEKSEIIKYCNYVYTSSKLEIKKGNAYPTPKDSFIQELQKDPKKTTYYVVCAFTVNFKEGFNENYRKRFEEKKRSKITDEEIYQFQDQLGEIIFSESLKVKSKLVTADLKEVYRYSQDKMDIIYSKFGK